MSSQFAIPVAALAGVACVLCPTPRRADAQWTITSLNPQDAYASHAFAVRAGQQAGEAWIHGSTGMTTCAGVWSGSSESWINLNPAGSSQSMAYGTDGSHQAGFAYVNQVSRASLWNGTPTSWVDLNPAAATGSAAYGVSEGRQAGWATIDGVQRASLWSGTPSSWIDLAPPGATQSVARAIAGAAQAGSATIGGVQRAGLWHGSADSWVDLSPVGASASTIQAIDAGLQAGNATIDGLQRASLWSGTSASWLDLSPAESTGSSVEAMFAGFQAGNAFFLNRPRAGVWSGSADSWEALPDSIPGGRTFRQTFATGIWSDSTTLYVSGYGYDSPDYFALVWTRPIPAPGAAASLLAIAGVLAAPRRRRAGHGPSRTEPRSVSIGIPSGSALAGRRIAQPGLPRGDLNFAVDRAGAHVLPAAVTVLHPSDHIAILVPGDSPEAPLEIVGPCTGM